MATDIQHVVDPPHNPEIAVFILSCAVAGEVDARDLAPILPHVAVGIAINGAQHSRPGFADDEEATGSVGNRLAFHGDDLRHDAGKRTGSGAGLGRDGSRQGRDHDVPGFGLPPGIDDGAALVANDLAVPHPGLGIDGLAHRAQQPETFHLVLVRPLVAPLDEGTDGGWGGVEDVHLVTINDRPESVRLGEIGSTFVHQAGGAVLQWSIHNVAVAGNPANVCCTPIGVFFLQIENQLGSVVGTHRIAARGVNDALGFSCRAGGVKDVEGMLSVERLRGTFVGRCRHQVMPPMIAAILHVDGSSGALVDHNFFHARTGFQGLLNRGKEFDFRAAAIGAVLGDDRDSLRVVDAIHQRVGREAAEHDGVRSADAGAREHRDGKLGRHAHVDGNAIAFLHAHRFEDVGELLHFLPELLVGIGANLSRFTFPDERGFVLAPGLHVAVEAVIRKIDLSARKPLRPGNIPFEHPVPLLEPVEFRGNPTPELFRLFNRFLVKAFVFRHGFDVRLLGKLRRAFKFSLLLQGGIDIDFRR